MAVVTARGLVRTFGEGRAVRGACSTARARRRAGEIVAVLGRSGSGKSTLLHVLGGLDRPEAGTVEVAGERVTGAGRAAPSALRRRHIGFVFQFFHLLPELTGEANVLLAGPRARRPPEPARGAGADRAARARARRRLAPAPALRRRAAALRDRPRAGQRPVAAARRRADGQPRRRGRRRGAARCCAALGRRGPRGRAGHARGGRGGDRRPRAAARRGAAWCPREAPRHAARGARGSRRGARRRHGRDGRLRAGDRLRPRRRGRPTCRT